MSNPAVSESGSSTHVSRVFSGQELNLKYSEDGSIVFWTDLAVAQGNTGATGSSTRRISIHTAAEDCAWNVYSTKKPLTSYHIQNRPPILDLHKEGKVVRIGNQLFFLDQVQSDGTSKSFVSTNLSLSVNEIVLHGRYLIVTSRQKVSDVPIVERDPPMKEDKVEMEKGKTSGTVEAKMANGDHKSSDACATTNHGDSNDRKADNSDTEPEPEDDQYEVSDSDGELSACESWSEGSTDLEEIGVRSVQDLRPELPETIFEKGQSMKKADRQDHDSRSEDVDSQSESADDDRSCGCCHSESDSDDSIVETENQRYESHAANDKEEFDQMIDQIFDNNRMERGYDSDSDNDDEEPDGVWEESGWALFGDDDDFYSGFQQFADDSDDCSDCGDDSGTCANPPQDDKSKTKEQEHAALAEPALGAPVAQIHVYDVSIPMIIDNKPGFKRIFHYQSMVEQPLSSSRPVMHPENSLLVWPIGNSKIMLADYKHNTYFVKRLRLSRFFSQHVAINCQFSSDGQFLHVVALERHGKSPVGRKQMAKLKKLKDKAAPEKEEIPIYDVILSTFRLSRGKTARAPPNLVYQVKQSLGPIEEKFALPTFTWTDDSVCIIHAIGDRRVREYQIQLFETTAKQTDSAIQIIEDEIQVDLIGTEVSTSGPVGGAARAKPNREGFSLNKVMQVRPSYKPETVEKNVTATEGMV